MSTRIAILIVLALAFAETARAQSELVGPGRPSEPVTPALAVVPSPLAQVPPPPILYGPEAVPPPLPLREPPPPEIIPGLRLEFAFRTWISTASSYITVAGANNAPPTLSRLDWVRLNNTVLDFSVGAIWRDRWIANAEFGVGTNGGGRMGDLDFNDDGTVSSATVHPVVNDNLFYVNIDFGYRFFIYDFGPRGRFVVDGLIGYQHWQERYLANDGYDMYPGDRLFPPGRTGENRFSWDSVRLGARARLEFPYWSLEGRVYGIPYTRFQDYDIHYLRDDVLHDPSFLDRASGGGGWQGDLTLRYNIWRGLNLEIGYRWWNLTSGSGQTTTRTPTGDLLTPFNQANTYRAGLTLGLMYRF